MPRENQLKINEIFHSIQGEGTRAGERCVFVRLTGCHLRCAYCDTEYAFHEGVWTSFDDILRQVAAYDCPFVEVTGGEPLLQPNVYALLERLAEAYPTVALETSGAVLMDRVDPRVIRIVDLKTPSSGECQRNEWRNIDLLTPRDEVKFVIGDRTDYEWSRDTVRRYDLSARAPVLFSPIIGCADRGGLSLYLGGLDPRALAEWMLEDRIAARMSLQLHKFIWDPAARGV